MGPGPGQSLGEVCHQPKEEEAPVMTVLHGKTFLRGSIENRLPMRLFVKDHNGR